MHIPDTADDCPSTHYHTRAPVRTFQDDEYNCECRRFRLSDFGTGGHAMDSGSAAVWNHVSSIPLMVEPGGDDQNLLCTSLVDWISGDRQGPTSRLLNELSIREQQQQHYGNIIQFSRLTRCWHTRWFRNSENRTHNTASRLKHDAYVCVRQHCWINTPCWVSRLQNMHVEGGRTHYMRTQTTALPPRGRHYTGMAIFRWGVVVTHFRRKKHTELTRKL